MAKNNQLEFQRIEYASFPNTVVMEAKVELKNDGTPDSNRHLVIRVFLGQEYHEIDGNIEIQLGILSNQSFIVIGSFECIDLKAINNLLYPLTRIKVKSFIELV